MRFLLIAVLLLAATAASAAASLPDVHYGPDTEQTLDVYRPEHAGAAPVILMVHGGAWRVGDKAMGRVVDNKTQHWLREGILFISINYRMLPERDALQQRDDVIAALVFAQAHASEWGGDPNRFILMGHSAGAHLVALVNANPTIAFEAGAKPWLGTVALDSGALDVPQIMLRKHYRFYDPAFGKDPQRWQQASPQHQLQNNAPPMLAVCSLKRADDPCAQARTFVDRAKSLGVRAEVLPQNLKHGQINDQLGEPGAYTDAVDAFIHSLLKTTASATAD